MAVAVAVAVAVGGGGAVAVAVPVAGLTKRFFHHIQKDFLIMFGVTKTKRNKRNDTNDWWCARVTKNPRVDVAAAHLFVLD